MNCGYSGTFAEFLAHDPAHIIAALHDALLDDGFSRHWSSQTAAWQDEIKVLRDAITALQCTNQRSTLLCLEYEIARRGRRIDAVIVHNNTVIVIEFKTGLASVDGVGQCQVRDYARDLRDFHAASATVPIIPILVTTAAPASPTAQAPDIQVRSTKVQEVITCTSNELAHILQTLPPIDNDTYILDPIAWRDAPYKPSLNIIEAAERIFAGQQVREISHSTADNLTGTVDAIVETVKAARERSERIVCFLTGVPGAGKTLAGLSAVHDPVLRPDDRAAAVFLSGNGPLVKIVRDALVRDLGRRHNRTIDSERQVATFIQNVHTFLGHYAFKAPNDIPPEHVVVFDEAQRAWNAEQMQRKKRGNHSEAALMFNVMERCPDWAVIVALVGFGQEIHQGEAGLHEWGNALRDKAHIWSVRASPVVMQAHTNHAVRLFSDEAPQGLALRTEPRLHLATSIRSLRATLVSEWVEAILQRDATTARALFQDSQDFPITFTRDLHVARDWLTAQAGPNPGNCGLVASSGGVRLRAYGLEVSSGFRHGYPYEEWFLANPTDTRAAGMLEVAATEFECQGLELDWVGLAWAGDLIFDEEGWHQRRFVGSRWLTVRNPVTRQFILNKYRVLLTRARRGMVLWVPPGSTTDLTIAKNHYDAIAAFFRRAGVPETPHSGLATARLSR